jgi:hypothetical protein
MSASMLPPEERRDRELDFGTHARGSAARSADFGTRARGSEARDSHSLRPGAHKPVSESLSGRVKRHEVALRRSERALVEGAVISDPDYGDVIIEPFEPEVWLADYPHVAEHLHSEHILHVKGLDEEERGLTWHKEKFAAAGMDPRLNPEAKVCEGARIGIQIQLGYFIVPADKLQDIRSHSLSREVAQAMEIQGDDGEVVAYRFFVHPEGYNHFRSLHSDPTIKYIAPSHSNFIGTPTSSYRSWAIRDVSFSDSVPFIVKVGVEGSVLGSDRWLSTGEVIRSVVSQRVFDGFPGSHFSSPEREGQICLFFVKL